MKFFIGGEHFFSPLLLFSKKKFDLDEYLDQRFEYEHKYFTGGGIHSLYQILKNISFEKEEYCLLPSYLCPTILKPFHSLGINYKFFKIDKRLQIDNEYLESAINSKCKAILFINYFGFSISKESEKLLLSFKFRGVYIVQDIVQSFFSEIKLIGDFCFNSFRKYFPINGSIILSNHQIEINNQCTNYNYLVNKTLGQLYRFSHYKFNLELSNQFLYHFVKAENQYYKNYNTGICGLSLYLLQRMDFNRMNKRRQYYTELFSTFKNFALFTTLPENVIPLTFPVLVKDRDTKRENLIAKNIFCPIHWKIDIEKLAGYTESMNISHNILSLPINENITSTDFDKYKKILEGIL